MRILHVNAGNLYGGVETMLLTLARESATDPAVSHSFLLCYPGNLKERLDAVGADVTLISTPRFSRPWTLVYSSLQLGKLLVERRFDVVGALCLVYRGVWFGL